MGGQGGGGGWLVRGAPVTLSIPETIKEGGGMVCPFHALYVQRLSLVIMVHLKLVCYLTILWMFQPPMYVKQGEHGSHKSIFGIFVSPDYVLAKGIILVLREST